MTTTDVLQLVKQLNEIGIMLSQEKDTDKLLSIILEGSMKITNSDSGTIYRVDIIDGNPFLTMTACHNTSRSFPFKSFSMPMNTNSLSGSCACNKRPYVFDNLENIDKSLGISHDNSFDLKIGYKTVNMLVIPLLNSSNDVIGVLQLMNKKRDYSIVLGDRDEIAKQIVPYTPFEIETITSLASQTAILFERNRLQREVEILFDGFVQSMVTTIESRDRTTSGHSLRVGKLMVRFAEGINNTNDGKYANLYYDEDKLESMKYAGYLHDIGKIGIKESILLKEGKLSKAEFEAIKYRFLFYHKLLCEKLQNSTITNQEQKYYHSLLQWLELIEKIQNSSSITDEEIQLIESISEITFTDIDETLKPLLTQDEKEKLCVRYGNLTDEERMQMNLHSELTYQILCNIPWSSNLKDVPKITSAHHEKIDGSGYPNRLKGDAICTETRMLTIVDIFEALTARDRPYKRAFTTDEAIQILKQDSMKGHLDSELLDIFIKEKVYEAI